MDSPKSNAAPGCSSPSSRRTALRAAAWPCLCREMSGPPTMPWPMNGSYGPNTGAAAWAAMDWSTVLGTKLRPRPSTNRVEKKMRVCGGSCSQAARMSPSGRPLRSMSSTPGRRASSAARRAMARAWSFSKVPEMSTACRVSGLRVRAERTRPRAWEAGSSTPLTRPPSGEARIRSLRGSGTLQRMTGTPGNRVAPCSTRKLVAGTSTQISRSMRLAP